MAEKVSVRGGGQFDGAQLENAASEVTLLRVAAAIEKMGGGGAGGKSASSKVNELFNKALDGNVKALNQTTDRSKIFSDMLGQTSKEAKALDSALSNTTKRSGVFGDLLGSTSKGVKNLESSLAGTTSRSSVFGDLLGTTGKEAKALDSALSNTTKRSSVFGDLLGTTGKEAKALESSLSGTTKRSSVFGDLLGTTGKEAKNLESSLSGTTDRSGVFGSILGSTGKEVKSFGGSITSAAGSIVGAGFGLIMTGIVAAGKGLLSFFTDGMEGLRETSSVGASFNNDITLLRKTAAEAAMPLEDFTAMVKQNSGLLAQLGGTVTQGAQSFAKMSRGVTTSEFGKNMQMMGMTSGDLNDYLSSYLDIQMRMGRLQGKSEAELIAGTEEYILEMDKLSKATGLSRKQTEEMLAKQLKEGRLSFMASKLTGDALKNFQAGVILTGSKFAPFQDTLTNAMAGIIKPGDKFGSMMATAVPGFLKFNKALGDGKLSTREQIQGYKDQAKNMKSFLGRFSSEMIAANPELAKMQEYLNSLNEIANANIDDAVKEQDKREEITKAMGTFGQVFQTVKSDIMLAMIKSKVFEKIQDVLKKFAEFFNKKSDLIGPFFEKIIGGLDDFLTGLTDAISTGSITDAFSGLFDSLKPIAMGLIRNLFEPPEQKKKRDELQAKKTSIQQGLKSGTINENSGDRQLADIQSQLDAMDSSSPVEMMLNGIKKSIEDTFPLVTKFFGFFSSDGEKSFSLVETAMNGFKWALDNIGTVLGVGGVVIAGVYLLGKALTSLGAGLATVLVPVAAVVAAFGLAAGGLGFMFEGVSKVIDSFVNGFKSIPVVLEQLTKLDSDKLKALGPALAAVADPLVSLAGGGILATLGGASGLTSIAKSLTAFGEVNADAIRNIAQPMIDLHKAMSLFTGSGFLEGLGKGISGLVSGDGGIKKFADSLSVLDKVNGTNISNIANGLQTLKTTLGDDLKNQSSGVTDFAKSIDTLSKSVSALGTSMSALDIAKLKETIAGTQGSAGSGSSGSGAAGSGSSTTPRTDNADKLNTLLTELVNLTKEVRDFNKDQVDAIRQRGSAMGGK